MPARSARESISYRVLRTQRYWNHTLTVDSEILNPRCSSLIELFARGQPNRPKSNLAFVGFPPKQSYVLDNTKLRG